MMQYAIIYFSALTIILVVCLALLRKYKKQDKEKSAALLQEYKSALAGTDKQKALAAGRKYYGQARRNGRLTTYDEQALSNDLNTMK